MIRGRAEAFISAVYLHMVFKSGTERSVWYSDVLRDQMTKPKQKCVMGNFTSFSLFSAASENRARGQVAHRCVTFSRTSWTRTKTTWKQPLGNTTLAFEAVHLMVLQSLICLEKLTYYIHIICTIYVLIGYYFPFFYSCTNLREYSLECTNSQ